MRTGSSRVEVEDDGVGGADPGQGSGLRGLADRVAALDGRLEVRSDAGHGTTVRATIPCESLEQAEPHRAHPRGEHEVALRPGVEHVRGAQVDDDVVAAEAADRGAQVRGRDAVDGAADDEDRHETVVLPEDDEGVKDGCERPHRVGTTTPAHRFVRRAEVLDSRLGPRRGGGSSRAARRPMESPMPFDLDHALRYLIAAEGSDLHLKVPAYPLVRLHGKLEPIMGAERLTPQDTERVLHEMLNDPNKLAEFEAENEVDFSYALEGLARFRVNAFRQKGFVSLVLRAIPVNIKSIEELSLPPVIRKLAEEERGIILLTGTTGSGKSTTLAAMIDHMNRTMHKHIVTIEDPIEFLHPDRNSIVNQREVGQDTASFKRALRRVLRQDPDVILVGEMRDEETVQTALSAAETGHLVLSTLHTVDASESINRIIDFFEPHQQSQARAMIAGTLKGIVSQRLVRTADGNGRVATAEILVMTGRVHDMIIDPKMTGQLPEVIAEGGYYGMQTFDQHLLQHLEAGRITMEEAIHVATSPHDFKLMVAAGGKPKGEGQAQHPGAPKECAEPRRPRTSCPASPTSPAGAVGAAGGRAATRRPRSPRPRPRTRRRRRRRPRPRASRRSVRRGLTRPAGPAKVLGQSGTPAGKGPIRTCRPRWRSSTRRSPRTRSPSRTPSSSRCASAPRARSRPRPGRWSPTRARSRSSTPARVDSGA